jgi:hypothetical protein
MVWKTKTKKHFNNLQNIVMNFHQDFMVNMQTDILQRWANYSGFAIVGKLDGPHKEKKM